MEPRRWRREGIMLKVEIMLVVEIMLEVEIMKEVEIMLNVEIVSRIFPRTLLNPLPACAAAPLLLPGSALASQDSLTPSAGLLGLVVSSRLRSVMVVMIVVVGMLVMIYIL